jgi:superfamily I DNA/RNA helicase
MLRPLMSAEQQQLIARTLDEGPRLVRGVAGSGKTVVLAHWLAKTMKSLADYPDAKVWAVYSNRALNGLLRTTISEAWGKEQGDMPFPWNKVEVLHVRDILQQLLNEVGLGIDQFGFDYDWAAESYMREVPLEEIAPRCEAMFIDEAQDAGTNTMAVLSALVKRTNPDNPNSRAVNIFYDNAQNIFGRTTPRWTDIGLDLRGRSSVMKESFRSTKPITELALNILYRLQPPEEDADHAELIERGLIEKTTRNNTEWWDVRFNQVDGPTPAFKQFPTETQEIGAICNQVLKWISDEAVSPRDICIISNSTNMGHTIAFRLNQQLLAVNAGAVFLAGAAFNPGDQRVIVTTPHSFKGYEAEIVVIAGVDKFVTQAGRILANNLYVAMTRARSGLMMYAQNTNDGNAAELMSIVKNCSETLLEHSETGNEPSSLDDIADILELIGHEHQGWLKGLWQGHVIQQEFILAEDGEILAEPLFWFEEDFQKFACFGRNEPGRGTRHKLEDAGIKIIKPGEAWELAG